MNLWTLVLRGLRHYRRTNTGLVAGSAIATAVLVGALVVGDSVRASLRGQAELRIGAVDAVLASNDRFLNREYLARVDMNADDESRLQELLTLHHARTESRTSGALLEVRDGLSGRSLGEMTLPGLDERIAWGVSQGAGLLAEETRVSVFELPA